MYGSSNFNGLQPDEANFLLLVVLSYLNICREAYPELAFFPYQFQSHSELIQLHTKHPNNQISQVT